LRKKESKLSIIARGSSSLKALKLQSRIDLNEAFVIKITETAVPG
jgi:hypothetical protein